MDCLARREYGRDELARKLESKGFDPDVAAAAVARLADEGLQSDQRYADSFVRSRIGQGKGPVRIRVELRERGLAAGLVEAAIEAAAEDWVALACEVRSRKFGRSLPTDFPDKARQMRFLEYRGFESAQIRAAVASRGDD